MPSMSTIRPTLFCTASLQVKSESRLCQCLFGEHSVKLNIMAVLDTSSQSQSENECSISINIL